MTDPLLQVTGFDAEIGLVYDHAERRRGARRTSASSPRCTSPTGSCTAASTARWSRSTASVGAALWFGDRGQVVGVSNHTNFLRATREGDLTVRATPVQRGRTQQLWTVEVRDEQQRLVAKGDVRLANLPTRGAPRPGEPRHRLLPGSAQRGPRGTTQCGRHAGHGPARSHR